jgi:hypothetical protein
LKQLFETHDSGGSGSSPTPYPAALSGEGGGGGGGAPAIDNYNNNNYSSASSSSSSASPSSAFLAASGAFTSAGVTTSSSLSLGGAAGTPSPLSQVSSQLDSVLPLFREAAKRGDSASFAILVAELCAGPHAAGLALPLCDTCLEDALRARVKEHALHASARESASQSKALIEAAVARAKGIATAAAAHSGGAPSSSDGSPLSSSAGALMVLGPSFVSLPSSPSTKDGSISVSSLMSILKEKEESLDREIEAARARIAKVRATKQALASKRAALAAVESSLWSEGRELSRNLATGRERLYALRLRGARSREFLSKLRRLSVHSDAFFVWHRGLFVTINGARLGRLPGIPVEWAEINAALGQMAFLLSTLASRLGFLFSRYRVIPMGSFSKLAPAGDERTTFELYYDNSFFATSRLNAALKALVACVAELGAHAEATDRSFRLPYAISSSGDKVADLPTAVGKDVPWTRAVKLVATNLKWLVAWAFRQPPPPLSGFAGGSGGGVGSGAIGQAAQQLGGQGYALPAGGGGGQT